MNTDCIFCKIISRQIPSQIIAENDDVLVIKDRAPKAPTHYLILLRKHIPDLTHISSDDTQRVGALLMMAHELSRNHGSFRLVMNNGASVGQSVFHAHVHFLAGKAMTDF